jgi:dihydroorotate dehydrogenase
VPDLYPLILPFLRCIDAERAHRLSIAALRRGLFLPATPVQDARLRQRLWGLTFPSPLGLAAGFDKNAEALDALFVLGFGFVEVGTVTLRPQAGNPRPRLFRLPADGAVINRMGFNSEGAEVVLHRLRLRRERAAAGIVGVNIGPNRDSTDPAGDCARLVALFAPVADYLVVNVSSPNTPGLRDLQRRDALTMLLDRVLAARAAANSGVPLLLKVSPDLARDGRAAIAEVAMAHGIDGLIATNTTIARPAGLRSRHRGETGGLSGAPLAPLAACSLGAFRDLTGGRLPLIGVGGIGCGEEAWARLHAGASLLQLYTALVYAGPGLIAGINRTLLQKLQAAGVSSLAALPAATSSGPRAGTAP